MDLNDLRNDYGLACLNEADLDPDPIRQFQAWLAEAIGCGEPEPNGTALATAGIDGQPSVRMVLLRGLDERGFSFYTNYESRKAQELAVNPRAALLFFWPRLERQVRVEGRVERVSAEESDHYFASRPRGARIGAWASPQSERIADRAALEARVQAVDQRFPPGEEIPRPPFWGGYRVIPVRIEFWQGGLDRLHDRLRYCREEGGAWRIERLGP